jgi:hypothetical protein
MAWPDAPVNPVDIPCLRYEDPFKDEEIVHLSPTAAMALCIVISANKLLLEIITAGDARKEAAVGSALISAMNRSTQNKGGVAPEAVADQVLACFNGQLESVINGDAAQQDRLARVLSLAAWSGSFVTALEVAVS